MIKIYQILRVKYGGGITLRKFLILLFYSILTMDFISEIRNPKYTVEKDFTLLYKPLLVL